MGCRSSIRVVLAALAAALAAGASATAAQAAPPPVGGLVPLPGLGHCYTASGNAGSCTAWPQLGVPVSVAITPSGAFAYVASGDLASGTGEILAATRDKSTGVLTPVRGTLGCYSNTGSSGAGPGTCTVAPGAGSGHANLGTGTSYELEGLAISSDGRYLYAASSPLNAIVWFAIDSTTGTLTEAGCLAETPLAGCDSANGLLSPESLALSPDGQTLYATSYDDSELAVFHRDPATGALAQLSGTAGCITLDGSSGACTADPMLSGPGPVVVSPDGSTVHVAAYSDSALLTYTVGARGALSRPAGAAGCVQDPVAGGPCAQFAPLGGVYGLAGSPDGKELYAGDYNSGGVAALATPVGRGPSLIDCTLESPVSPPPACAAGAGLNFVNDLAAAPDGAAVYGAADGGGVIAFARDAATGGLGQFAGAAGCQAGISTPSSDASCGYDPVVQGPYAIAVSPDSGFVYAAGVNRADTPASGWLTAYSAVAAPSCRGNSVTLIAGQTVTLPLTCTDLDGNPITLSITGAPAYGTLGAIDQANRAVAYTAAAGYSGADSITFAASDGTNGSTPATVQITVTAPQTTPPTAITTGTQTPPAMVRVVLSGLRVARHKGAFAVSYRLNMGARVTVRVKRVLAGRRAGGRCVAPTRVNRGHRACTRLSTVPGSLAYGGQAGANRFTFAGRIGGRRLGAGSYQLVIVASVGGRSSAPATVALQIPS